MIICPRCRKKIDVEREKVERMVKCPHCHNPLTVDSVIPTLQFADCITEVRYVGINSQEDAQAILEMMKG